MCLAFYFFYFYFFAVAEASGSIAGTGPLTDTRLERLLQQGFGGLRRDDLRVLAARRSLSLLALLDKDLPYQEQPLGAPYSDLPASRLVLEEFATHLFDRVVDVSDH
mmetsp:Transcript_16356/g.35849  ORF Transcript_16356/g.35849 Transcript_16356/m.35849 type:complete len:107 (+) Transcript_16356:478-798(+)